jgi:hypothetical protein
MVLAATVVLVLSACRLAGGGGSGTPGPSPSGASGSPLAHPTGGEVVVQVRYEGGFVPPEHVFAAFPTFTLLGDGRVIVAGAQIDSYPGPALPAMLVRTLHGAGLQAVVREAMDSGQLDADAAWRGAASNVADASDTVFTLNADGRSVTVSVYALGLYQEGGPTDWLDDEERAAHQALAGLADRLQYLEGWLADSAWADAEWSAYRPETIGLLVRNVDGEAPDDSGIQRQERTWPLAVSPETFGQPWLLDEVGRCGTVTGGEAATWYHELSQASQLTRWIHDGHRYAVTPRLLLPGEASPCPAA